jgi:hypothetical protein
MQRLWLSCGKQNRNKDRHTGRSDSAFYHQQNNPCAPVLSSETACATKRAEARKCQSNKMDLKESSAKPTSRVSISFSKIFPVLERIFEALFRISCPDRRRSTPSTDPIEAGASACKPGASIRKTYKRPNEPRGAVVHRLVTANTPIRLLCRHAAKEAIFRPRANTA